MASEEARSLVRLHLSDGDKPYRVVSGEALAEAIDRFAADAVARERERCACYKDIAEARAKLLTCYRLGTQRGVDAALTRIEKAEAKLDKLARHSAIRARSGEEGGD